MNTFQIAGGVLLLVISVIIIVSVLMQDPPRAGLGSLAGDSTGDTFMDRNKNRTNAAALSRITKYCGFAFFAVALAIMAVSVYAK